MINKEEKMKETLQFLKDAGTFYLATVDGDQPRVRPFGAVVEFEGKLGSLTVRTLITES